VGEGMKKRDEEMLLMSIEQAHAHGVLPESFIEGTKYLSEDWKSKECPVCQESKWPNSPFCRSCSIKIHRARMFHGWKGWTRASVNLIIRKGYFWAWAIWYDRCRDYLLAQRAAALVAAHHDLA
jgi:hypothetical protein